MPDINMLALKYVFCEINGVIQRMYHIPDDLHGNHMGLSGISRELRSGLLREHLSYPGRGWYLPSPNIEFVYARLTKAIDNDQR